MSTRQALLDAIRRNREDDTPRLIYADYLDGEVDPPEPEWAELIRVQCELTKCGPYPFTVCHASELAPNDHPWKRGGAPRIKSKEPCGWCPVCSLKRRESELLLRDPIANTFGDPMKNWENPGFCCHWSKGFVKGMNCSWDWWSAHAAAILPEHPGLERVTLTTPPEVEHLVGAAPGEYAYRLKGQTFVIAGPASLNYDGIGKTLILGEWGGDPKEGGWGVTFDLPRPGAHGDQYRHWTGSELMTRERIVVAMNTLNGCIGCVSEDRAVDLIEGLIREATEERQELCAQVGAATAPHAGRNCGCGECAGANGAAEAIRSIGTTAKVRG